MAITIPGLGAVTQDGDWLVSEPRQVRVVGRPCRFMINAYDPQDSASLMACIEAFCSLGLEDLAAASPDVFAYYHDTVAETAGAPGVPEIAEPSEVWDFVTLSDEPFVDRDDASWYVVLDNGCAWEPEHGLMIVLKEGREVVKVGGFDGHLTNRHAFGDDSIPEDAVYWNLFSQR